MYSVCNSEWCWFQFVGHYAEVKDDGTGRIESVMSGDVNTAADLEPTAAGTEAGEQNLSPKEKKQLEKETKAREKKQKAEEKRLLKEQDRKIKEEAKKKTETPAEKRRRRRQEERNAAAGSSTGKSPLSFLSPKRPGVRAKKVKQCRVHLLDGTDYDFEIEVWKFYCVYSV